MIGAMKSPEAQYQLAMRLPIEQLQAILRGQPSEIDQPTALTALKQKMQQRTAAQGIEAQQRLQQPSIKDRMLAQMPENMGIATAPGAQQVPAIPDGGVTGFATGGEVRHFQTGGTQGELFRTPFDPDVSRQRVIDATRQRIAQLAAQGVPASVAEQAVAAEAAGGPSAASTLSRFFPQVSGQSATMAGLRGLGSLGAQALAAARPWSGPLAGAAATYQLAEPVMRATGVTQGVTDYLADLTGLADKEKAALETKPVERRTPAATEPGYRGKNYVDPRFVDTKALEPASGPARRPAQPQAEAPVELGAMPDKILASQDFGIDKDTAAAVPAGIERLATGEAAAPTRTGFESALGQIGSATQPYMDKMTALLRTMTPTAEEKESRNAERKGVMALKAAQALLQSGTTSGAARGSALGQIAELTAAYGKEDREDKKAMIGAEINMLGAQAQLAQGNSKLALDLFQHAEKLAADAIRFDAEKLFKQRELDLKEKGLWNEKVFGEESLKMKRYIADQEAAVRRQHIGMLAAQGNRYDLQHQAAMERSRVAEQGQSLRAYASLLEAQIKNNIYATPAEKKAMQTELANLTKQLRGSLGMPDIAPPPSIQIPESRIDPRNIIE